MSWLVIPQQVLSKEANTNINTLYIFFKDTIEYEFGYT